LNDWTDFRFVAPLFVPGNRPERFAKAAASGADAVLIDLEDAVPPDAKAAAREALRADFTTLPVLVRINATGTPWHADDLAAVDRLDLAGIILPKAEAGPALDNLATRHRIVALVESVRGIAQARTLAAHPRVARLAFGSMDYCADLGCAHIREALLVPRTELAVASRLASRPSPLDGVTAALDDLALAESDARHACDLGFGGKLCVHPRQVAAVLRGMRPSEAELVWARAVEAAGPGVSVVGAMMVDAPVRARALHILARAAAQ
jgi:citrate lyase subunit beta/citryl-CoA lyase